MSDGASFDTTEVGLLGDDLLKAVVAVPIQVRAVVARGAFNIKKDAARRVTGLKHAPAYPRSISYDSHDSPMGPWAEIGPDKDKRQGALGNLLEFGSVKNPPHPHMAPAAEAELPKFAAALEALAVKALGL